MENEEVSSLSKLIRVAHETNKARLFCPNKKQPKLFSPQLRQIFTNFDNFWHKDGQDNRIV